MRDDYVTTFLPDSDSCCDNECKKECVENVEYISAKDTDKIYLQNSKYCVKDILDVKIELDIQKCKEIDSCCGKKIVVSGTKCISITFEVSNKKNKCGIEQCECKNISQDFKIPFCYFLDIDECIHVNTDICNIRYNIDYWKVDKTCGGNGIFIFTLLCFKFKVKHNQCKCDKACSCEKEHFYKKKCNKKQQCYNYCNQTPYLSANCDSFSDIEFD